MEVHTCQKSGTINQGNPLSKGFGNMISFLQWDNKVYWKADQNFEPWNHWADGINETRDSAIKKPYVQYIIDKNYSSGLFGVIP